MEITFETGVTALPGVGEKRAALLRKIEIRTTGDILYYFPRGYQNRGDICSVMSPLADTCRAYILTVSSRPTTAQLPSFNRTTITKFTAFDETGKCAVVFFNQLYVKDQFAVGQTFRFWGKMTQKKSGRELNSPLYERYDENGLPLAPFVAVYPLTAGLTQKFISSLSGYLLDKIAVYPENIPQSVREKYNLCTAKEAFVWMHRPESEQHIKAAREYFIFEELYLFAKTVIQSQRDRKKYPAMPISVSRSVMNEFAAALPFPMTGAQIRAIEEMRADLSGGYPMNRLLAGDVGSGKTVCAAAAAYIAAKCGFQCAMMVPTEILAFQHFADLEPLFEKFGIRSALLTGSTKTAQKKKIYAGLSSGEIDFVVGTHALLSENVEFFKLGLVITDEQHRFGITQREALSDKNPSDQFRVHTLVMSATPIPRSLAMVVYGDLDLSILDELPPGRQKIDTFVVNESYRSRLNAFIRKHVENDNQVYIVCPAIENKKDDDSENAISENTAVSDDDLLPLKNAEETAHHLKNEIFPEYSIAYIHGKMKSSEKEAVMTDFAHNKIQILVSTTVIEVGVNVPNATLMIIENAERFGLSQLHQLRGRVGRGKTKSYCILVSDTQNQQSLARLSVMHQSNDGFKIAEHDLEQRGPGDFLPAANPHRQHGDLNFKIASLSNMDQLKSAFEAARNAGCGGEGEKDVKGTLGA